MSLMFICIGNPTFVGGILDVLLVCAKEEMRRIDTTAIVASVADQQTVWNRSVVDLIRDTMRLVVQPFVLKLSIAMHCLACNPNVAAVREPMLNQDL